MINLKSETVRNIYWLYSFENKGSSWIRNVSTRLYNFTARPAQKKRRRNALITTFTSSSGDTMQLQLKKSKELWFIIMKSQNKKKVFMSEFIFHDSFFSQNCKKQSCNFLFVYFMAETSFLGSSIHYSIINLTLETDLKESFLRLWWRGVAFGVFVSAWMDVQAAGGVLTWWTLAHRRAQRWAWHSLSATMRRLRMNVTSCSTSSAWSSVTPNWRIWSRDPLW